MWLLRQAIPDLQNIVGHYDESHRESVTRAQPVAAERTGVVVALHDMRDQAQRARGVDGLLEVEVVRGVVGVSGDEVDRVDPPSEPPRAPPHRLDGCGRSRRWDRGRF